MLRLASAIWDNDLVGRSIFGHLWIGFRGIGDGCWQVRVDGIGAVVARQLPCDRDSMNEIECAVPETWGFG